MRQVLKPFFQISKREKWICSIFILFIIMFHFYGYQFISYIRYWSLNASTPSSFVWREKYEIWIPDEYYLSKNNPNERSLMICNGVTGCGDSIYVWDSFAKPDPDTIKMLADLDPNQSVVELDSCKGNGAPCLWEEYLIKDLGGKLIKVEVHFLNRKLKAEYIGTKKYIDVFERFIGDIKFKQSSNAY
ncbi:MULTISPECIES: hypothetical protein [unclassified Nitrospina]|uniref:hypothetical protein n=1 Tax=unclassified Nitrospina TaxID=2638683 RepID=UPI003F986019